MVLRRATRSLLWSTAALVLPAFVGAQGYAVNEIGTCAVARSFAVTAGACQDASLIFWNPAGTVKLDGISALAGASLISLKGNYIQDTTGRTFKANPPTAVVPHLFINQHMKGTKYAIGGAIYVPYGLTSQWTDEPQFPGRFLAEKAALQVIHFQANFAWQINDKWSIGGGPIAAKANVELQQGVDLSSQVALAATSTSPAVTFAQVGIAKNTQFADLDLKGHGHAFGFTGGIMGKINDKWTVGARYMSKMRILYKNADAVFTPVLTGLTFPAAVGSIPAGTSIDALVASQFTTGKLVKQQGRAEITNPDQAQIGFNYADYKGWNIEADYQWTGWKKFKYITVSFDSVALNRTLLEAYNNASSFRIGAERAFANKAHLRLGVSGVTTAAPEASVTPLLPEQERAYYMIGGSYPLTSMFTLDGAYGRVATFGRRGRTDDRPLTMVGPELLNNGVYTLSGNIFSVSLKASY